MSNLDSWITHSSTVVYETPFLEVLSDEVTMPNGKPGHYGWMKSKSEAVYIVPITDNDEVILVQQRRYTLGSLATLECVAGGLHEGETHVEAGARELLEEAGYQADSMTPVFDDDPLIYPSVSKTYDPYKLYIARGLHKVSDSLDADDGIESNILVALDDLPDRILAGDIVCSQSIASLLAAHARITKERASSDSKT